MFFIANTDKEAERSPPGCFLCYYVSKTHKEDAAVAALLLLGLTSTFMATAMSALDEPKLFVHHPPWTGYLTC